MTNNIDLLQKGQITKYGDTKDSSNTSHYELKAVWKQIIIESKVKWYFEHHRCVTTRKNNRSTLTSGTTWTENTLLKGKVGLTGDAAVVCTLCPRESLERLFINPTSHFKVFLFESFN